VGKAAIFGIVAAGDGVVAVLGTGEFAVGNLEVGFVPIDDEPVLVRSGAAMDGVGVGTDVVGGVRVQAVKAIDPSPMSNLKYFTINLN
jgi:hypothetical protein